MIRVSPWSENERKGALGFICVIFQTMANQQKLRITHQAERRCVRNPKFFVGGIVEVALATKQFRYAYQPLWCREDRRIRVSPWSENGCRKPEGLMYEVFSE